MKDTNRTNNERQKALKDRRKALGLVRYELWVKPEHKPKIKEFADSLK